MKVSISLLTFLEFCHLCKAKLVPFFSEMSNIRVKIELLLAAYYAVFPVCFKSQRNMCSTIICDSAVVNLLIVHYSMQCEELLFHKQIPSFANIKKTKIVGFELGKEIQKDAFHLVVSVVKEKVLRFHVVVCLLSYHQ